MHRASGPGHQSGHYTDGDPVAGVPPTTVIADDMDSIQEEICAVIEGAGITLDPGNDAQLRSAILQMVGANIQQALKNAVTNADFEVWQRGTSFPVNTTPQYTADRWKYVAAGGWTGSVTVSRQGFSPGQTDVPGNPHYYYRINNSGGMTGGTNPYWGVLQKCECVCLFAGQQVVYSFWAKANKNAIAKVSYEQNFGTGGSASVVQTPVNINLTTAWQRFFVTATLPSVSGKTISGGDDWVGFTLACFDTTGVILDVANVQFELGAAPTGFELVPLPVALGRCYRFYEKSYAMATAPGTVTTAGCLSGTDSNGAALNTVHQRFRAEKRATPTILWWSPDSGASGQIYYNGADRAVTGTNYTSSSATGVPVTAHNPGAPQGALVHWTADAEL